MRLDRGKDVFVHVSTCINYDLNALTQVMWKLWRWYDVRVSTSRRKNENEWSVITARNHH